MTLTQRSGICCHAPKRPIPPCYSGGHEYWIHRYEGALNGIDKAVVLLAYPKSAFGNHYALRVFICSDLTLSDEEILAHYTVLYEYPPAFVCRHSLFQNRFVHFVILLI